MQGALLLSISSCVKFFESNYIIAQFLYVYFMAHVWKKRQNKTKKPLKYSLTVLAS